jgi:hypothetical protein
MIKKNYPTEIIKGRIVGSSAYYALIFLSTLMFSGYMTISTLLNTTDLPIFADIAICLSILALSLPFFIKYYIIDSLNDIRTLSISSVFLCFSTAVFTLATLEGTRHILIYAHRWNDDPEMYRNYKTYPIHMIFAWVLFFIPMLNFWAAFKYKKIFYTLLPLSIYLAISFILFFTPLRYTLSPFHIFIHDTLKNIQLFTIKQ